MDINRIKFKSGLKNNWETKNPILEYRNIGIEFIPNEVDDIIDVKIKGGIGNTWNDTPYIFSQELNGFVEKVQNKFAVFTANGILYDSQGNEIDLFANLSIEDLLGVDQNIVSDSELEGLRGLLIKEPVVDFFLTTRETELVTGEALTGTVNFEINISNYEDLKDATGGKIVASSGNFNEGRTRIFDIKKPTTVNVSMVLSSAFSFTSPSELIFTLYTVDKNDVETEKGKVIFNWSAIIYYGTGQSKSVVDYNNLTNLLNHKTKNIKDGFIYSFTHSNLSLYDYFFVEKSIANNINLSMINYKTGFLFGTTVNGINNYQAEVTINSKQYYVYVTEDKFKSDSKAVIK